eukprot:SAG11_NODE_24664_length_370_cov_0.476015_2_plen_37_part_01
MRFEAELATALELLKEELQDSTVRAGAVSRRRADMTR